MEARSVAHVPEPGYPTRRELLGGAASFVLVAVTSCTSPSATGGPRGTVVAPIFVHGEGCGAMGCVVVSPPVFLSEEEGLQILREALAEQGIRLGPSGTLAGVRLPLREWERRDENGEAVPVSGEKGADAGHPFPLDGIDPDRHVAVGFLSQRDYFARGGAPSDCTVQGYDFQEVARRLAELASKQGKDQVFLGLFYDPMARLQPEPLEQVRTAGDWREIWEQRNRQMKAQSAQLLRTQANDFVAWLKEQKAL